MDLILISLRDAPPTGRSERVRGKYLPPGSVNVQQVETTVFGQLGEWIEVAGVVQGMPNQQTGILGSTREISGDNRRILLKVDEIR